jgi:hypothetical protein
MRSVPRQHLLRSVLSVVLIGLHSTPVRAAEPTSSPAVSQTAGRSNEAIDPDAAVLEVVPPLWVQRSPHADLLWDRLIRKHAALLADPSLARQVLQQPESQFARLRKDAGSLTTFSRAVRVSIIAGTPLLKVSLDPAFKLGDGKALTEMLVKQYVENVKTAVSNEVLQNLVSIANDRRRFEFREEAITKELPDLIKKVAIDEPTSRPADPMDRVGYELERERLDRARNDLREVRRRLDELDAKRDELRAAEAAPLEVKIVRLPM